MVKNEDVSKSIENTGETAKREYEKQQRRGMMKTDRLSSTQSFLLTYMCGMFILLTWGGGRRLRTGSTKRTSRASTFFSS